ncbi:MAG: hydroxyethylthiazole kinase [Coriobacteriales bacterium]|nr:hydroxyethylthiazole kinase [Coriobacteriales bacterium]
MASFDTNRIATAAQNVRDKHPLTHCITNYVTVNDCANAVLAIGASPIMGDEPEDVAQIQRICGGLDVNIGTLTKSVVEGMHAASKVATQLSHPLLLDPVGAGASDIRTRTACSIIDEAHVWVVRGNMSEIKALAGAAASTRGVDVSPDDKVSEQNLGRSAEFVRQAASKLGCILAVTGAIDLISDGTRVVAVRNGAPLMGCITGSGCMLSATTTSFLAANTDDPFGATVASVVSMGAAGEVAASRMRPLDGNGSFRTYLLDALYNQTPESVSGAARAEEL